MQHDVMIPVRMTGTAEQLWAWARPWGKHVDQWVTRARVDVRQGKKQINEWQGACLYALASRLDADGAGALEIGTALGYSAYLIARAMPHTYVVTLNPSDSERHIARQALDPLAVECLGERSWELLSHNTRKWDLIFVDGDHVNVGRDLPWFNQLKEGGLILFHDYSPSGPRVCLPVYDAVSMLAEGLGRLLDVRLMDEQGTGLAGLYRRMGEEWAG